MAELNRPRSVHVGLSDEHGNEVPLERATITQGDVVRSCDLEGSRASCSAGAGKARVTVEAQGQSVEHEVEIARTTQETCHDTVALALKLDGAGCPKPEGTAIEGQLIDVAGTVVSGRVEIQLNFQRVACELNAARFRCPSLSPYPATYTLWASLGASDVEREIEVDAADCAPVLVDGTIDLRTRACPESHEPRFAVTVFVQLPKDVDVSAQINTGDGEPRACQLGPFLAQDSGLVEFYCPSLTPTGGGQYRVEVRVGAKRQSAEVDVRDDGCAPRPGARLEFKF